VNNRIGQRLISLRGTRTRYEVADAVGVTYSAIKMYELGSRMPKDDIKIKLANYFNVPVGDLFFSVEHHKT